MPGVVRVFALYLLDIEIRVPEHEQNTVKLKGAGNVNGFRCASRFGSARIFRAFGR